MANLRTIAPEPQATELIELKEDSQIWASLKKRSAQVLDFNAGS
jgi:hypothetical protein